MWWAKGDSIVFEILPLSVLKIVFDKLSKTSYLATLENSLKKIYYRVSWVPLCRISLVLSVFKSLLDTYIPNFPHTKLTIVFFSLESPDD